MEADATTMTSQPIDQDVGGMQNPSLADLHARYITATEQLTLLERQGASTEDLKSQKLVVSNIGCAINARAAVSRIPVEIRGAIFTHIREDWPLRLVHHQVISEDDETASEVDTVSTTLDLAWITVTHVSKEWRDAGLAFGHLWSFINASVVGPKWASEMLSRSKEAPLKIGYPYAPQPNGGHDFLAAAMSHVETLNIDNFREAGFFNPEQDEILEIVQKIPAPILKNLLLRAQSTFRFDEDRGFEANFFTLPSLLLEESSCLRLETLYLENIIPCWTSPLFSTAHIRTLIITFENSYEDGLEELQQIIDMSPTELLSALSSLAPSLEELILDNCLPLIGKWREAAGQCAEISLPSLKSIDISCDSLEVLFGFTGYLSVSGTVRLLSFRVDSLDDSSVVRPDDWIKGMYLKLARIIRSFCFAYSAAELDIFNSLSVELSPDPRVDPDEMDEEENELIQPQPYLTLLLSSGSSSSSLRSQLYSPKISVHMPLDLPMTGPVFTLHMLETLPVSWSQLKSLKATSWSSDSSGGTDRAQWTVEQAERLVAMLGGSQSELTTLDCGCGFSSAIISVLRDSDPANVFPKLSKIEIQDDREIYLKYPFDQWIYDLRPHWPRAGTQHSGLGSLFEGIYKVLKVREAHGSKLSHLHVTTFPGSEEIVPDGEERVGMRMSAIEEWEDVFRELEQEIKHLVLEPKIAFYKS